jgi:hypothetical protein
MGGPGEMLLDLTEGETGNSIEVLNALLADPAETVAALPDLRETSLTHEQTNISPELISVVGSIVVRNAPRSVPPSRTGLGAHDPP